MGHGRKHGRSCGDEEGEARTLRGAQRLWIARLVWNREGVLKQPRCVDEEGTTENMACPEGLESEFGNGFMEAGVVEEETRRWMNG
jgi:hypothetical protein